MDKIRVLLVDDSLLIRRALRDCFRVDPEIEVVGVAENGKRALEKVQSLSPDVITLDIEMPDMNGLETLRELRARGSNVPVIIFSKYTPLGATLTMEALELGASDVLEKPAARGDKGSPSDVVKRQLRSRIRALGRKRSEAGKISDSRLKAVESTRTFTIERPISAVAISVSTGGPSALIDVVSKLSPEIACPLFVTQHMPPVFTRYLANRLAARGTLKAVEAWDGMPVEGGTIYVAPGDFHMRARYEEEEVYIELSQDAHENSCRPSADVMLRSLAAIYGNGLLSIVMTGMGQDGKQGCQVVKSCGGLVVAQDEATSLVWGMARSVVAAKLPDAVVPLDYIPALINASCRRKPGDS